MLSRSHREAAGEELKERRSRGRMLRIRLDLTATGRCGRLRVRDLRACRRKRISAPES